jgi:hypothetical protein
MCLGSGGGGDVEQGWSLVHNNVISRLRCLCCTGGTFLPVTPLGDQTSGGVHGVHGVPLKVRADKLLILEKRVHGSTDSGQDRDWL